MPETGPSLVEQPELTKRGRSRLEEVAFLALVGLSVIGESVTNYSPDHQLLVLANDDPGLRHNCYHHRMVPSSGTWHLG
jgi:hypothetical protein